MVNGDFNIDFIETENHYLLEQLQQDLYLRPIFKNTTTFYRKDTTRSQLDWVFTKCYSLTNSSDIIKAQLFSSWFTDHLPIHIELKS
jgi:endonuclease/exonuclease/phosphatase family metal-dependent hydrolase